MKEAEVLLDIAIQLEDIRRKLSAIGYHGFAEDVQELVERAQMHAAEEAASQ